MHRLQGLYQLVMSAVLGKPLICLSVDFLVFSGIQLLMKTPNSLICQTWTLQESRTVLPCQEQQNDNAC